MITKKSDVATIREVRQFIEENYRKKITVELLCRRFGLNRTKAQEGFKQLFKFPVIAFLFQVRMERARVLLTETDQSIKAIALESGYKDVSSFIRAFKKLHQLTPDQYRAAVLTKVHAEPSTSKPS